MRTILQPPLGTKLLTWTMTESSKGMSANLAEHTDTSPSKKTKTQKNNKKINKRTDLWATNGGASLQIWTTFGASL